MHVQRAARYNGKWKADRRAIDVNNMYMLIAAWCHATPAMNLPHANMHRYFASQAGT